MGGYKTDQCRVFHRGRSFHFVTYEGHGANEKKELAAEPNTWYLMSAGKRWTVMPVVPDQPVETRDRELVRWLEENVLKDDATERTPILTDYASGRKV